MTQKTDPSTQLNNVVFSKAPLPFIGQKRNFINHFRQIISDNVPGDGTGWTIIDVFGGSGLLAHNAKRLKPNAKVIYNDYDGFAKRLTSIEDTNRLRSILSELLSDYPRSKLLDNATKQKVKDVLLGFNGNIDVQTVATWLLFSGQQVSTLEDLLNNSMYNRIRKTNIPNAAGYLDGLEIVSESYTSLMPKYANDSKVLFVLDPPYVNTAQGAYGLDKYFGMIDFLLIMQHVRPPYLFFSSTKSELPAYLDHIKTYKPDEWQRIGNYQQITQKANINKSASYEDHLIYRFK